MATILARRTPLSHRQLTFLRTHILRQRKKTEANSLLEENESNQKESDLKLQRGDETLTSDNDIKPDHSGQSDRCETTKEAEAESPEDIASQIEAHQTRLESLREEKHRLFQQLKMVLHEEDERKRLKEEEQKQELDKSLHVGGVVAHLDPRLSQSSMGLKRPLPVSPPISVPGSQDPPVKKAHRAPLLPTPDATAGGTTSSSTVPYIRQGSGGSFRHLSGEAYHNSARQHYPPGTHVGQRPHFPDQRFGPGPHDSRMIAHPQASLQAGIVQHPTQLYGGAQTLPYQYAPTSSPYGTISSVQPPSSQTSQLHYQQVPRFMHPHEVSIQGQYIPSFGHGQPHPHEVNLAPAQQPHELTQMQGHAHFGTQLGTPGPCHTNNLHGVSYTGHIQDPRHQKVLDQHRSTSSPTQLSKQESYTSAVGSPSSPVPASRERKPRK